MIDPHAAGAPRARPAGEIDYRLVRQSVLSAYRKGRAARHDLCDAHPELVRAARHVGKETTEPCPICEEANVVHVTYLFGPGLPPQGRCVTSELEIRRERRPGVELAGYVVEVCPLCSWNHLHRAFVVSGPRSRSGRSG